MKKNFYLISFIICLCLTALFTVLVLTVDVKAIGPENTSVGFSYLNSLIHDGIGVHFVLNNVTDWLGVIIIGIVVSFFIMGVIQLFKRKNLFKVDKEIIALGCLYLVLAITYVFFEKVIVNYRPVIMPEAVKVEASFPSSHTVLAVSVLGSAFLVCDKYIKSKKLLLGAKIICIILCAFTVIGRLVSGVHWFTDIIAGILYSLTYIFAYGFFIHLKGNKSSKEE